MGRLKHEQTMENGLEQRPAPGRTECLDFEKEWVRRVFVEALQQLESGLKQPDRELIWIIFLRRRLFPLARQGPAESLEETAAHIQRVFGAVLSVQKISNCQKTAERRLHHCIRDVLAEYCRSAEDIEEELMALIEILRGGIALPTRMCPPQAVN
jgi:hypothetical protein